MTKRSLPATFFEQYADNPHVTVELIGEPITLKDGTQFGLFDMRFLPTDRHEVRAVRLGEQIEVQHYIAEEDVLELGEGNFHLGVIKAARNCVDPRLI